MTIIGISALRELLSKIKTIATQFTTMPTANAENVNRVIQYIGETGTYTQGHFYKNIHTQINGSITATETDNSDTLDITSVDAATFKSKLSPGTYNFVNIGYPTKLVYIDLSSIPMDTINLTRESAFDRAVLNIYAWIDDTNAYYATDTLTPGAGTTLYEYDIQTGEVGAAKPHMFISSSDPSSTTGYWVLQEGQINTPVNLMDYGIYMSTYGLPTTSFVVTYIAADSYYTWTQIDTQPRWSVTRQTLTITVSDWNGGTSCTKTVQGLSGNDIVICESSDANVHRTSQSDGALTFTAASTPTADVTIQIVIMK